MLKTKNNRLAFCSAVDNKEEFDFRPLRLDWLRLQVCEFMYNVKFHKE